MLDTRSAHPPSNRAVGLSGLLDGFSELQRLWNRQDAKSAKIVAKNNVTKSFACALRSLRLCGSNDMAASDTKTETETG
jgi:hypothetical protein